MTGKTVVPEEAVEAAAKVMHGRKDDETTFGEVARAALEAAAPSIAAKALEQVRLAQEVAWAKGATSAGVDLMAMQAAGINPNPYRAAAVRGEG